MKSISITLLVCLTSTAILGDIGIALAQEKRLTTIAVADLEAQEGVSVEEARTLSDRLRAELVKTRMFDVVERSKVDRALEELRFQLSDISDQSRVVELGRWIGAEKMMAGSVGKVGQVYAVSLWLVDLKTGKTEDPATEDCRCEIGELLGVIGNLARQLAGVPSPVPVPPLPKPVQTPLPPKITFGLFLAGRVGYLSPKGELVDDPHGSDISFGIEAGYRISILTIGFRLDYYNDEEETYSESSKEGLFGLSERTLTETSELEIIIPTVGARIDLGFLYLGGGYGIYKIEGQEKSKLTGSRESYDISNPTVSEHLIGWHLNAGFKYPLEESKSTFIFIEGQLNRAEEGDKILECVGIYGGLGVTIGKLE